MFFLFNLLQRLKIKIYTEFKLRKVKQKGKMIHVIPTLSIRNPQYFTIGDKCYFGPGCRLEAWDEYLGERFNPKIEIGVDVRINSTCHIGCINHIQIGENVLLGSHVVILDHNHGKATKEESYLHPSERPLYSKGEVVIGKNCWLGENVCVLAGVHIGDNCIVGANSVVTKDMPPNSVIAGNPATVVKKIV